MTRNRLIVAAAAALCLLGSEASAQLLPASSPSQLVTALQARGLKPGSGFRPSGPTRCRRGNAGAEYIFMCSTTMVDGGRGGRAATVDIMIFRSYSFARLKAMLKQNLDASSAEVKATMSNKLDADAGGGRHYSPPFSCVQGRGQHNGPATCIMAASPNVAIMTDVTPLHPGTRGIENNMTDDDMDHASMLAGNGLEAVLSAAGLAGPPPPPARKPKCTIWQVC